MKDFQYVLFDLDGTLTDSMLGITRAVQYALKHYGITVEDLKELQPFVGPPLHESFQEYFHLYFISDLYLKFLCFGDGVDFMCCLLSY